jgi:hypothetical protein
MAPHFPAKSGSNDRHFDAASAPKFAIPSADEYAGGKEKSIPFFASGPFFG